MHLIFKIRDSGLAVVVISTTCGSSSTCATECSVSSAVPFSSRELRVRCSPIHASSRPTSAGPTTRPKEEASA